MSNSKDEIEELRKQVLYVAQTVSGFMCESSYNMCLHYFRGDELKAYAKRFGEKEGNILDEIFQATTVEKTLEIASNFYKELFAYVKATKVDTADKAMEIAHSFIKKYSPVALPMKADREGDVWLVDIDVGPLEVKMAKVKVDARTGDILSYEIPSK
jgi:hypothetical protein